MRKRCRCRSKGWCASTSKFAGAIRCRGLGRRPRRVERRPNRPRKPRPPSPIAHPPDRERGEKTGGGAPLPGEGRAMGEGLGVRSLRAALLLALVALPAFATQVRIFQVQSQAGFLSGTLEGVSVDSLG